jgi:hypothetical protein
MTRDRAAGFDCRSGRSQAPAASQTYPRASQARPGRARHRTPQFIPTATIRVPKTPNATVHPTRSTTNMVFSLIMGP